MNLGPLRRGVVGAITTVTAIAPSARSDSYIDGMIFGVGVGVPVGLVATGGAVAGGVSDGDGGRPTTSAMAFALSAGSVSVLWGSLLLVQGAHVSGNQVLQLAPGAFDVTAGLTACVLTLYRNARPRSTAGATLLPAVGRGLGGEWVPTLRLVWTG